MAEPDDEADDSEYNLAPVENEPASFGFPNQPAAGHDQPVLIQTKAGKAALKRKRSKPIYELIGVVTGGVTGLIIGMILLTYVFKVDPFGLFPPPKKAAETAPAVPPSSPNGSGQIPGPPTPQIPGPPTSPQIPGPPAPQIPGPPPAP